MTASSGPISVERVTDALRRSGVLDAGHVSALDVMSSRDTILSRIIRLRLTYDTDAPSAPATLILKSGLPERSGWNAGRHEVAFYSQVGAAVPGRFTPRC